MGNRGRAWRRSQDDRIIQKRLDIVNNVWKNNWMNLGPGVIQNSPGLLRKWNFTCDCGCCTMEKLYYKTDALRTRREQKRITDAEYYEYLGLNDRCVNVLMFPS